MVIFTEIPTPFSSQSEMTTRHPFLNKRTKINFTHTRHVTPHHRLYTPYGYETNMMQRKAPREIKKIFHVRVQVHIVHVIISFPETMGSAGSLPRSLCKVEFWSYR